MYPENDDKFEDVRVESVDGNSIKREDGWSFFVPDDSPIKPAPGMMARFYGRGIGYPVRGLFLDGRKVFYRTEAEEVTHFNQQTYGADCAEWLRRWDEGRGVWSIEMGGIGPGYEQCIQITVAEILRHLLATNPDPESSAEWKRCCDATEAAVMGLPAIKALGLSGAQWGAASGLAVALYRRGPVETLTDPDAKDRLIQVSKTFPQGAAA